MASQERQRRRNSVWNSKRTAPRNAPSVTLSLILPTGVTKVASLRSALVVAQRGRLVVAPLGQWAPSSG